MYGTTMTMVGRLVDWPARWDVTSGPKATFRLAKSERRYDRTEEKWVDGQTLYLGVTCWRVLAERVLATLSKGDPVVVTGRLHTREWEKDGRRQSVTELEATAVGPDLAYCSAAVIRKPAAGSAPGSGDGSDAVGADPGTGGAQRTVPAAGDDSWNGAEAVEDPWSTEPDRVEAPVGT